MADNITAWSMSVIATNEAGQAGIVRKELRTRVFRMTRFHAT